MVSEFFVFVFYLGDYDRSSQLLLMVIIVLVKNKNKKKPHTLKRQVIKQTYRNAHSFMLIFIMI